MKQLAALLKPVPGMLHSPLPFFRFNSVSTIHWCPFILLDWWKESLWENKTQWPSHASHLNLWTCSSVVHYPLFNCISHPTVQYYDYFVSKRQMESTCTCMTDSTHISPYLMCWIIVTSPPINHHALSVMCRSFFWCQQGTTCWYCLKRQKSPVYVCQISCPSTGIHVHALISMFGTQNFLPKRTCQKEKENSFIEDETWFLLFSIPCYWPWCGLQYLICH